MGRSGKSGGKKLLLFLLLAAIIVLAVYFITAAKKEADDDAKFAMCSNSERVEFLNKHGWIVKPDPVSKENVTIPSEFNDLYKKYAELQATQGFDLEKYKGKEAILYSYTVLNYPGYSENVTANLLVSDDRLIAGEITLNEENGFTEPLIKVIEEQTSEETTTAAVTEETAETAVTS
ncbi:MAG: DUF4830 domain-containing protein [Oscillospiraceae bacterium]